MAARASVKMSAALAALVLLSAFAGSEAVCDLCMKQLSATDPFYSVPFDPSVETCSYYSGGACCGVDTITAISKGDFVFNTPTTTYNYSKCDGTKPMSYSCKSYFTWHQCFYACDVNLAKYRANEDCQPNGTAIAAMPIQSTWFDAWYNACKDDYFCVTQGATKNDTSYFATASPTCQCATFQSIYGGGKAMCEDMFAGIYVYDDSFVISRDSSATDLGYVMAWNNTDGSSTNPNDATYPQVVAPDPCLDVLTSLPAGSTRESQCPSGTSGFTNFSNYIYPCEVCKLRNDQTLDVALPNPDLAGTPCAKYSQNACCSRETALKTNVRQAELDLYGKTWAWDKCYYYNPDLSTPPEDFNKCAEWFTQENCLYECDVNAGKWRLQPDCAEGNGWQIQNMPLKASECDAWYNDCKKVFICACKNATDCKAGMAPKDLFALSDTNAELCKNNGTQQYCGRTVGEIWDNGTEWCELLFSNSFTYEEVEAAAYSLAWNDTLVGGNVDTYPTNPNNDVEPLKPYPANCPSFDSTNASCTAAGVIVSGSTLNSSSPPPPKSSVGRLALPILALALTTLSATLFV